jgi:hypothetical protein
MGYRGVEVERKMLEMCWGRRHYGECCGCTMRNIYVEEYMIDFDTSGSFTRLLTAVQVNSLRGYVDEERTTNLVLVQ